jgi:hypothetical protein
MPHFHTMPIGEAVARLNAVRTTDASRQYRRYLDDLAPGEASCLILSEDERIGVVRARLSATARAVGRGVKIRRASDQLLFWTD